MKSLNSAADLQHIEVARVVAGRIAPRHNRPRGGASGPVQGRADEVRTSPLAVVAVEDDDEF